jgi:hypothetical protein
MRHALLMALIYQSKLPLPTIGHLLFTIQALIPFHMYPIQAVFEGGHQPGKVNDQKD